MLAALDRALAPVTWLAAAFAVAVLLIGPELIGARKPGAAATYAPAPAGLQVFRSAGCGSCHTLAAAGANGTAGPNLDDLAPDQATVETTVRTGAGSMPSFQGRLSDAEIRAVAIFVATKTSGT
jgi:mono/diheme cytochrome c family protein